jgi:hypothetical protein
VAVWCVYILIEAHILVRETEIRGSHVCQHQREFVLVITNNCFWCHHAPFGRVLSVGIVVRC